MAGTILTISILHQILRSAFSVTAAEGNKLMNGTADLSSVPRLGHIHVSSPQGVIKCTAKAACCPVSRGFYAACDIWDI